MKRPGKPQGQYYLSHQTLDSGHGIIIGLTVTPGDVHDTVPYLEQLETIHQTVLPLGAAAADSAYDFPLAHRELEKLGITFFVRPQAVHDRTQVEFKRNAFSYQPDQDSYLCPQGKTLRPKGLYRSASGRRRRTASAARCGTNASASMTGAAPASWRTATSSPLSSEAGADRRRRTTGRP